MPGPGGTINLTNGNDVFPGVGDSNTGNEIIFGLAGNDTVSGGIGNDGINGGLGNDSLSGNDGDDTLVGEAGDDVLDGGAGVDVAEYLNFNYGINIDLRVELQATMPGLGTDRLVSIEGVSGTWLDDVIVGNDLANSIAGYDGSDTLLGGGGNDEISDGASNSQTANIDGGAGDDVVTFSFDDTTTGTIGGGIGSDILRAYPYANAVHLEHLSVSGFEILETTQPGVYASAAQLESFDIIRSAPGFSNLSALLIFASGTPQVLDISDELSLGGSPRSATVIGSADNEAITVSDGNDYLRGGAGDDFLNGGIGNDVLVGDAGNDELNGGAGTDKTDYSNATSGIAIDLRVETQATTGGLGTDRLVSIEGVVGSAFNDVITGNDFANVIEGGAGTDILIGGGGNDQIIDTGFGTEVLNIDAGANNDVVTLRFYALAYASLSGLLAGGTGLDTLRIEYGSSSIQNASLSGFEILDTGSYGISLTAVQLESFDTIRGNASGTGKAFVSIADTGSAQTIDLTDELNSGASPRSIWLIGSSSKDAVTSGDGSDTLEGAGGNDVLNGGAGNDLIYGETSSLVDNGIDTLNGGAGDDKIVDYRGVRTTIDGGDGNDTALIGSTFTSGTLNGGAGIDSLEANDSLSLQPLTITGFEILNTGFVHHVVRATAAQFEVFETTRVSAANPTAEVALGIVAIGGSQTLDLSDELNSGGGPRGVLLFGSNDDETITTGDGRDTLYCGQGNDTANGGGGNDQLLGDDGNDSLYGGLGDDGLYGVAGQDLLDGGGGSDVLQGGDGDDTLNGGDGNDQLNGEAGINTLNGGLGDDLLEGMGSADTIIGGAGSDIIRSYGTATDIDGGDGDDLVQLGVSYNASITLSGNLDGGAGIDTLDTAPINLQPFNITRFEILRLSNASFYPTTGTAAQFESFDRIVSSSPYPNPSVVIAIAPIGASQAMNLSDELNTGGYALRVVVQGSTDHESVVSGSGDDWLQGRDGNDFLDGGFGYDQVEGGNGNDVLAGGLGSDSLDGGLGADIFAFRTIAEGGDQIAGWVGGEDNIQIGAAGFGGGLTAGALAADRLVIGPGAAATGGFGQFLYDTTTGILSWDVDGSGSATAVFVAGLLGTFASPIPTLAASDFIIVNGPGGSHVLSNGNDVFPGTSFDNSGSETVQGFDGNDRISGGFGNDILKGDAGDDVLRGDSDNDTLEGGADSDDIRGGEGNDRISGGDGGDTSLSGESGADRVNGGLGNDRIDGGEGNDVLYGEGGVDVVLGGSGNDRADGGDDNDVVSGGDGNDILIGGSGADRLDGGAGNDRITGGSSNDVLIGGGGADRFVFDQPSDGNDRIDDWSAVDDQIGIDASAFGGGLAAGALAANRLVTSGAPVANQAFGQFLFNTVTGQLSWDADGTGAGAAVLLARLYNGGVAVTTLAAGDFDIVA